MWLFRRGTRMGRLTFLALLEGGKGGALAMVKKADYLHHERCQPLPYYGGKQAKGKAKWIAGLLPWRKNSTYCETHGGMMSVLVTRAAVAN